MGKGNSRRVSRELKYTLIEQPRRKIVGLRGQRPEISPDPKMGRHGRPPERREPPEHWQ